MWRHTESTEAHRFIFDMLKNSAPLSSLHPLRENINPRETYFCGGLGTVNAGKTTPKILHEKTKPIVAKIISNLF